MALESAYSGTQTLELLMRPVAIFWDVENCPVPGGVKPDEVAANVRMALQVHPALKGAVKIFSAYGDFNYFPLKLREGFQRTGVSLLDVPNTRKDASDKAILIDMFLFAIDNPPPSTIFLISGDVDFAPALHKLGQRGYSIELAVSSNTGVASSLCSAGQFVWNWLCLARGEGLVPFTVKSIEAESPGGNVTQRGDIEVLKCQIAKLLNLHGGELPLGRVRMEYSRLFGRSLYLAEYKASRLSHLIGRMSDSFSITGDGARMTISLKQVPETSGACIQQDCSTSLSYKDVVNHHDINGSLFLSKCKHFTVDSLSESDTEEQLNDYNTFSFDWEARENLMDFQFHVSATSNVCGLETVDLPSDEYHQEVRLEIFKLELEELLVCHACKIPITSFLLLYKQRYGHQLDLITLGVESLELLFEKVKDVAKLEEDLGTRRKYLVAQWG